MLLVSMPAAAPLTPLEAAAGAWRWPVDPPRSIARQYLAPPTPYAAGHRGLDIRAPRAILYAPAGGIVHFAGVVVDRPVLSIRHGDGVISSFEPVAATVAAGDAVSRGQVVGTVLAGHCVTVCVHVGVRVDGEYVSPMAWFGGIPASVLWPTRAMPEVDAMTEVGAMPEVGATMPPWVSSTMRRAFSSRQPSSGVLGSRRITPAPPEFFWCRGGRVPGDRRSRTKAW